MNTKLIVGAGIGAALLLGYWGASPYLAANSLGRAVEAGDTAAIGEYVDFPSVRESLKEQLTTEAMNRAAADGTVKDNALAAIGVALIKPIVGHVVDSIVTPSGVGQLATKGLPKLDLTAATTTPAATAAAASGKPLDVETTAAYDGLNRFNVTVKAHGGNAAQVVMRREGLFSWRVRDVVLSQGTREALFASKGEPERVAVVAAPIAPETPTAGPAEPETALAAPAATAFDACMEQADGVMPYMQDCSQAELDRQNARLNVAYSRALATTPDASALRTVQRQWIAARDATCAVDDDSESAGLLNLIECEREQAARRADELEAML